MAITNRSLERITNEILEEQARTEEYASAHNLTKEDMSSSAGFVDRFRTSNELMRFQQKDTYDAMLLDKILESRRQYNVAQGKDPYNLQTDQNFMMFSLQDQKQLLQSLEEELIRTRDKVPDTNLKAGIKTYQEIEQELVQEYKDASMRDQVETVNSTFLGKAGFIAGTIKGYAESPFNITTAAAPGAGIITQLGRMGFQQAAKAVLKVAAQEEIVTAMQFLRDQPTSVAVREKAFGEEITKEDQLKELGMQALITGAASLVGGAAIAGAGRVVSKYSHIPNEALNRTDEVIKADFANKVGGTRKVGEDPLYSERDFIQDEVDLAKTAPDGVSQQQHAAQYEEAAYQYVYGEGVNLKNVPTDPVKKSPFQETLDIVPPERLDDLKQPFTNKNEYVKEQYNKMQGEFAQLVDEDELFPQFDEGGNKIGIETVGDFKRKLNELNNDTSAIDEVIKCWSKGGPSGKV